ncbi:hypothetical protein [Modestobacter sp. NPDC049651]|uniref:hypothetical protein n=1 Tax=unclassified Modestobacter TaxID=2643866 RepID=UPI0033C262B3
MRSGSVDDLDFERHPVTSIAVLAHWLIGRGFNDEDAVIRLRATNVGPRAMQAAAELMTGSERQDDALTHARDLLLQAAIDPPPDGGQRQPS